MLPGRGLLLKPHAGGGGGGGTWTTVRSVTPDDTSTGWAGYTLRERVLASALTDVTGTQIRVTLHAGAGNPINVTKMYIGPKGAGTHDFASAPTQILFSGGATTTVSAGATKVSDGVAFSYDGTADLIFAIYTSGTTDYQVKGVTGTGSTIVFKLGDDATTLVASGYSAASSTNIFDLIEALV